MVGDSRMAESTADAAPGILEGSESGMVIASNSGEEDKRGVDEGDRSFGGNRWPRQETSALLKLRSDMDAVFRDSSLKGPLWEEVSRKLAELGYHRSAKKCKEKFENVYKYHKRTKDGRKRKADGKTYRFFDELEALENLHSLRSLSPSKPQTNATPSINPAISTQAVPIQYCVNPTSSSTASDDDSDEGSSMKKRKWQEFFRRLTKEVIQKQEELQNKFLQTVEKWEQERVAREEARRIQEMAWINREHEILVQERSDGVAKDAAVIALLEKMSGLQPDTVKVQPPPAPPLKKPQRQPQPKTPTQVLNLETSIVTNGGNNVVLSSSPSRWPKAEVEALIKLRTSLDIKYRENEPKAPLWEEISAAMRQLGYNRNAKRCKEKWENINKYFKKVKESNKRRPEDSKTCPYFHQLEAIYKEKISRNDNSSLGSSGHGVMPDSTTEQLMVRPEQQWPPQEEISQQAEVAMMEEDERENVDQIQEEEEDNGDSEEEYEGNDFELVAKKTAPIDIGE